MLKDGDVFKCHNPHKMGAAEFSAARASLAVLLSGANLDSLLMRYQGGSSTHITCSVLDVLLQPCSWYGWLLSCQNGLALLGAWLAATLLPPSWLLFTMLMCRRCKPAQMGQICHRTLTECSSV